ncbi:GGDEF domain-containing protein [Cryptosporangium phraense]|uniref:GGDEF domain-containing protein n=1 Tax=Cryptosporangium phraense TaxID=2593070 RepID=A0A545AQB0_9ACTN|nr:GGDEF domain-containing protein [Cryptosporangium phraense]TQS43512.1 GGDEF domain-containing protein [Cryptosporangium phraense]
MEKRRALAVTIAVFAAAYYAIAVFLAHGTSAFAPVASVGGALACYAAAAGAGWAARRAVRTTRRGWAAVGVGLAMWATGNSLSFAWYLSGKEGYSHVVDFLYLSAIPILLYGLTSLLAAQLPTVPYRMLLDGLIIAGSLFVVSWGAVLGQVAHEEKADVNWAIAMAYPITDVVMASVVLLVLSAAERGNRASLGLLSAGFLLTAGGDVAYALLDRLGNYSSNGVVNLVWFVSYELMMLGGVWAATGTQRTPERVEFPQYTLLPYIPFSLAIGTAVTVVFLPGGLGPVIVVTTASLVMMVLGRQLMTVRENVTLNARLEALVAELRQREEELEHRAYHDALTELPNRALFHSRVEDAIAAHDGNVTVLYVDLDGFKAVNDRYGHGVGDALLVLVADKLRTCAGSARQVARLGGDEFAVLLPATTDPADGTALASRIVSSIGAISDVDGYPVTIGASVGVAVNQSDGRVGELLRAADLAMYAAKIEGKGRYALVGSAVGAIDQAAVSSAAPNETWKRAHQIETLVSVVKSASSGTG